jgi:hypothetical protein
VFHQTTSTAGSSIEPLRDGHQRFAVFAAADQAAVAVLVAEHRLVRVTAQAVGFGAGQGGSCELARPSAFTVRLRVSESPTCTCSGSGFQLSLRSGCVPAATAVGGVGHGLGLDRQQQFTELTRISLPVSAPARGVLAGCASTRVALKSAPG